MTEKIEDQAQLGYGKCLDCDWFGKEEGCNVSRGSSTCLLNIKIIPITSNPPICDVEELCTYKNCKEPHPYLSYVTYSNCSCRRCIPTLLDKKCGFSGEAYNTDSDCLEKL
jgi:hypothetical protein